MSSNRKGVRPEVTEKEIRDVKLDLYLGGVVLLALISFAVFAFSYLGTGDTNTAFTKRYRDYNDGWTLEIDGERQSVDLPRGVKSGEDDVIILRKALPATIERYSAIATRNYHMQMEVRINDKLVATFPQWDNDEKLKLVSDEWVIIDLEPSHARDIIEIKLTNTANTPFSGYISDIYYGDSNSVIQHIINSTLGLLISGLVVLIFGIVLIIAGIVYRKYSDQRAHLAMGFVLSCFGVWLTDRSKFPLFLLNSNLVFIWSLFALLMIAPFIFMYSLARHNEMRHISKWLTRASMIVSLGIILSSFFINYNIQSIAMYGYGAAVLGILYNGFLLGRGCFGERAKYKTRSILWIDRTEFIATILFPIVGILEVVYYSHQLWSEISGLYRIAILIYAAIYTVTIFWRNYLLLQENAVVTEKLQESQMELMMGQIQPHFIFNTLSSIRTLIKIAPDTAYNMLYDFSNYLRANVDNITNLDGIRFAAEVEHIKSYVNIEKVRFGDRLEVDYDIEASDFLVPPLSIQPLVENAVKHGVCQKAEGGKVLLKSYEGEDAYIVEIDDTGIGLSQEAINKLFAIYKNDINEQYGMNSNEGVVIAMKEIISNSTFLDENGNPMTVSTATEVVDHRGNGSREHRSTGMKNIILRLTELSGATMIIYSKVGEGMNVKVRFPKNKEDDE